MDYLESLPASLNTLSKKVNRLYYIGNTALLTNPLVAIVGSRRPSAYTRQHTALLAQALAARGVCVLSGAAMGVDAIAHQGAFPSTIAVMGNSLDIIYPKVNRDLIQRLQKQALVLSEYEKGTTATRYSFVERNRIVVALSQAVIITQADLQSGSMRSAQIALKLGRPLYVLPQRLGESDGTNALLQEGKATLITDIQAFANGFGDLHVEQDDLLDFCSKEHSLEKAIALFGERVYEYELEGKVLIDGVSIRPCS